MNKFYKTIVMVEVLSDSPIGNPSLSEVEYLISEGGCTGEYWVESVSELTPKEMAQCCIEHGSDPEFFEIDSDGNSVND